jgi:5-methylthioadenosine/S-adenosylhomocysteine deaminase
MVDTVELLIKNGFLITLDPERRVYRDGAVAYEGDRIVAVGRTDGLEGEHGSEAVIDAKGKIVMPGLVNAHNHIYQTLMRGTSDDRRRSPRPRRYSWNIDALEHLDRGLSYDAGMLAAAEMIRSGVTTTQDSHYINFHLDSIDGVARSMEDSGMRVVLGRGCWDLPGLAPQELTEDVETAVRESEAAIRRLHEGADGRITMRVEASLLSQCTDEMIQATKRVATDNGVGWALHIQERLAVNPRDPRTGDPEMRRYGGRAIEYLDSLRVLGSDSLLIHCTFADDRDISVLSKTGTPVAHCPNANAWAGRARVTAVPVMLSNGVTVGLGTDGALTNDSLDLFQAMKFCALIHKVNTGTSAAMTAEKVIEMSTIDSAKALQMEAEVGSLEPGKKADIIILDMKTPGLTPSLLPVKNLVYSAASGRSVETVIIDGETVMEDGGITAFDEAEAYRRGEEAAWRMMELSGRLESEPGHLTPPPWRYE